MEKIKLTKEQKNKMWEAKYGDKTNVRCRCFAPMEKSKLGDKNDKKGWDIGLKAFRKNGNDVDNLRPLCNNCLKHQKN